MTFKTGILAALVVGGSFVSVAVLAAPATVPNKPWHVRDLRQDGANSCSAGGWGFMASWTPIIHNGSPLSTYKVAGSVCKSSAYTCTAVKCTARISECAKGRDAVAMVTADYGVSVSGMRSATVAGCK